MLWLLLALILALPPNDGYSHSMLLGGLGNKPQAAPIAVIGKIAHRAHKKAMHGGQQKHQENFQVKPMGHILVPGAGDAFTTISADWATYPANYNSSGGPYWALNSVWNNSGLTNGTNYTQSITVDKEQFPSNTTITWSWPSTPASGNVYSYPSILYGTYQDFSPPATNITPMQVNNITTLTLAHNITLNGDLTEYDCIYDMYLTPTPGQQQGGSFEVEVHVHTPQFFVDYVNQYTKHSFTDGQGTQWEFVLIPNSLPLLIFTRADFADLANYTVDFKQLLLAAKSAGLITGNEYFDGLALGIEPREIGGSMTINYWSITYN